MLQAGLAPDDNSVNVGYGDGGAGAGFSKSLINLALLFTVIGTGISLVSVWLHWKNYRKPNQQRQVVRILWMVPIYGISTFISLVSLDVAFYVDTFRDIYEAFVIYAFFNLLLNKLGGERALIIMLHSRPPTENIFPGTLWSREIYVGDPYTFLFVKRGILQFIYVKPVLAIITMVLKAVGKYDEGVINWSSAYAYLTFFYNLTVCLSLWCLMVFFYATKRDLSDFRPLPKFLCVKAIIFFSFWQSVIVALLVSVHVIPEGEHISVAIQDFLVCLEMVPFAIAHSYAFSFEDYDDRTVHSARMPIFRAIRDSFGLKDVIMDTKDTLAGSKFNYRAFEPSEGVPHIGSSRTSRIMAGLRYSSSTAKKHWIEPAPTSRFLHGPRTVVEMGIHDDPEPLEFENPDPLDPVEQLYKSSRAMKFGDFNYPVIDARMPLWKQVRYPGQYGGLAMQSAESQYPTTGSQHHREGCIDVVVERGKGNYVVVTDEPQPLNTPSQQSSRSSRTLRQTPQPTPTSSSTIPATKNAQRITQPGLPSSSIPTKSHHRSSPPQPPPSQPVSQTPRLDNTNGAAQWAWPNPAPSVHQDPLDEEETYLTGNVWK